MPITRELRTVCLVDRFDLTRLSRAERLFVWRHRRSEPGKIAAAIELGLPVRRYAQLETGELTRLTLDQLPAVARAISDVEPTRGELCFLARRRSGLTLKIIENELDVSRPTFYEMERSGHAAVVRYWENRGFVFP